MAEARPYSFRRGRGWKDTKWMKDQKKQINFQKKKRSLRKMKRSSEKQDLPSPLFESFSAVIIAKKMLDKSMAVHGPAV